MGKATNRVKRRRTNGNGTEYTGIKMERNLYDQAKQRASARHQTYSEYVRQLIVRDIEKDLQPA